MQYLTVPHLQEDADLQALQTLPHIVTFCTIWVRSIVHTWRLMGQLDRHSNKCLRKACLKILHSKAILYGCWTVFHSLDVLYHTVCKESTVVNDYKSCKIAVREILAKTSRYLLYCRAHQLHLSKWSNIIKSTEPMLQTSTIIVVKIPPKKQRNLFISSILKSIWIKLRYTLLLYDTVHSIKLI